ncbi:response regulator [Sphingomonas sp. MA1305]|nr:response regulator [Sphingomonas sp. MA1305]MBI0474135.1 response regulator [Sphingomonas sp. MA1305]
MLVEDELFVALDVQMTIEEAGLSVEGPYTSLAEAEAALSTLDPHALLCAVLDVRLRDGEVFPAADRLKAAGVPIIFHSGHADQQALERRYPGALVCGKPCSPGTLRSSIQSIAEHVED